MNWRPTIRMPGKAPAGVGAVLLAALGGTYAMTTLTGYEGNVLAVYRDVGGVPTYCAGRADRTAPVGAKISTDDCAAVNKSTVLEYGYAVLGCTTWGRLSGYRLIALTTFAINVGKKAACESRAFTLINNGLVAQGCAALAHGPDGRPVWSFVNGQYVPGLQKRRQAEAAMCLKEGGPP